MKNLLWSLSSFVFIALIGCVDEEPDVTPDDPSGNPDPVETYDFAVDIGNSIIPYVVIDTEGVQIENEPKVPATMRIFEEQEEVQTLTVGIEYRGSTSFRISDKKSFGIETWDASGNDMDVSIFGFPEEEDWILQGHVVNPEGSFIIDRTMMYHYLGYTWSRDIGRYASRTKFVELELNGSYQGLYVFMEKLKRDGDRIDISRLDPDDVDQTGGFILKIDKTTGGDENIGQPLEYFENNWEDDARYTQANSFRSQYDIFGELIDFEPFQPPYHSQQYLETYFLYEDPDYDVITNDQKLYIQQYIHDFETALLSDDFNASDRTYTDYIDMNSFVEYLLLTELVRNIDAYRLSTYLYKDKGGKLNMGPIWDLNIGFDSGGRIPWDGWVYQYNNYVESDAWMVHFWWPRLMEDPIFKAAVKDRWQALRSGPLSTSNLLTSINETSNYLINNGAVSRNYSIWDRGIGVDYPGSIQSLKEYIEFRSTWMDGEIAAF